MALPTQVFVRSAARFCHCFHCDNAFRGDIVETRDVAGPRGSLPLFMGSCVSRWVEIGDLGM